MSKSRDTKPNDEFQLMRQIFDNLQYLDYETAFNPIHRNLPYLNPLYFAIPGQSSKEQFDYFASLCVWIMQTFLGSEIETPSEYDEPATVADSLMLALPAIGFKLSFSSSKLVPGYGLAVCTILDALLRQAIKKKRFAPNPFQAISGLGGEQTMEVVGGEDDDGIVDDAANVDDPDEDDFVTIVGFDDGPEKVVDSLELQKEAERVASRLQIRIPAAKSDWRSHFSMMTSHHQKINELMAQLAPILAKVGADVTRAIESIQTREKSLNTRFQDTISDYATRAASLEQVEKQYKERTATVGKLQNELNGIVGKLEKMKDNLNDKQRSASDTTPLTKIRSAIVQLKEEVKKLEIQSAILQRSLTQTWLEERDFNLE
jgi:estrogen-related receptor beta like 1